MSQNHRPAAPAIDPTKKSSLFEVPFRGSVDYKKLAHTMQLAEEQFITFAQTVGYPKA